MLARERANVIPAADFKEILVNVQCSSSLQLHFYVTEQFSHVLVQPNHERNPLEELSALADEEREQVEEEKEKTPRAEASRGEHCGITAEDLDFGMEEFEEEAVDPKIAEDASDSDSLEELLDQLSDGK